MGSKRSKKTKQELELFTEQSDMKTNTEDNETVTPEINDFNNEINAVIPVAVKATKRKKKSEEGEEVPKKVKKNNANEPKKVTVKKRKTKSESVASDENLENKLQMNGGNRVEVNGKIQKNTVKKKKRDIGWPNNDIVDLINRMDSNIPEKDDLAYRSRVEKMNWDTVAFKNYTPDDCKKTWMQVQKRMRRFRLLREVLNDAKEWVATSKINHNKLPRPRKHPDMPRRPLSSYLLFYLNQKDQIISEHPGLDGGDITKLVGQIYKSLTPDQRQKYEKMAASSREEYMEKLKIFFEKHPEYVRPQRMNHKFQKLEKEKQERLEKEKALKLEREKAAAAKLEKEKAAKGEKDKLPRVSKDRRKPVDRKPGRPPKAGSPGERPPKKCQTPFGLYYASEMKNIEPGIEKGVFRDKCKELYKQMPDVKKVYWINLAELDLIRYQEEVKAYKAKYPKYQVHRVKSILTKREKASKERASGKPVKPPNSAYALFSKIMLQGEQIKSIHPKDRMNYIAGKWKNCPEEEQNTYRDRVVVSMEQYRNDYQKYVDSLPEDEKRKIINQQKRKGRRGRSSRVRKPKKRKTEKKPPPTKLKFTEPEQPPISACKFFTSQFKGEGDPVQAWKALNADEKRKYEEELVKKKQAYIVEFERFLKSLSKEELEAFSKSRQQQVQSDDEESSECSSGSEAANDDEEEDEEQEKHEENGEETHNNADVTRESESE